MWNFSPLYFLKFLDADIISKGPQEDREVFQKAPDSKQLYYILTCTNLSYMDFCNLNYILLVCKTFL